MKLVKRTLGKSWRVLYSIGRKKTCFHLELTGSHRRSSVVAKCLIRQSRSGCCVGILNVGQRMRGPTCRRQAAKMREKRQKIYWRSRKQQAFMAITIGPYCQSLLGDWCLMINGKQKMNDPWLLEMAKIIESLFFFLTKHCRNVTEGLGGGWASSQKLYKWLRF